MFLREQGLDFETLMPGMCSVFAELKREIIPERIHAGLTRARALGRTPGRKAVSARTEDRVRELRGVAFWTIRRVLAANRVVACAQILHLRFLDCKSWRLELRQAAAQDVL